jgi:hypothetical protein
LRDGIAANQDSNNGLNPRLHGAGRIDRVSGMNEQVASRATLCGAS